MGDLMRRYWQPVAAIAELDDHPTKAIRLMGEDLVLYKDLSGNYGLVERHCPHRRADLSYGFVEAGGLRCSYHGWCFDAAGRCIEAPFEETANPNQRFTQTIKITAYPVEAKAGLLWAYLGPQPAPLVPNWEPFTWQNGFVQIAFAEVPCNWFQCQENSIDPVHFEWQHSNLAVRLAGSTGPYTARHTKIGFKEFDYGWTYHRVREDTDEQIELWTVGRACLWPNALFTTQHFEWRVPIDDENTLSVTWHFARVPREREPYVQKRIPYWTGPLTDPATGRWITSHVMNQDFMAWVGQGRISDRTGEHLGRSDAGVVVIRNQFLADIEAIREGRDPKAIVRDPAANRCIPLPMLSKEHFVNGLTMADIKAGPLLALSVTPDRYIFQSGQPEAILREYEAVVGFPCTHEPYVPKTNF